MSPTLMGHPSRSHPTKFWSGYLEVMAVCGRRQTWLAEWIGTDKVQQQPPVCNDGLVALSEACEPNVSNHFPVY